MNLSLKQILSEGLEAHKKGNYLEAEKKYHYVLSSYPLNPDANHNLGLISVFLNKVDESFSFFKKALKANPKVEQFWLSYIETLINENKLQSAKIVINKARKFGLSKEIIFNFNKKIIAKIQNPTPTASIINNLSNYFNNNNLIEAETLSFSLTKKFPNHPFAWKALSAILYANKRYEDALIPLKKNIELSPNDPESHNNLGVILQKLKKFYTSQASYRRAIELKPDYVEAFINLANCLQELNNLKEAEIFYRKAIELKPDSAEAFNNLGQIYYNNNILKEAIHCYIQAIKILPSLTTALVNLGILLKEGINFNSYNNDLNFSISKLLDNNSLYRPTEISRSIINLIKCEPQIKLILKEFLSNSSLVNIEDNIKILSKNELLLKLMSICPLIDLELEGLLKEIRSNIIQNISKINIKFESNNFLIALALQCHMNEYIYEETSKEKKALIKLEKKIEDNLLNDFQPSITELAILASYKPLNECLWANILSVNSENELLLNQQIQEYKREKKYKAQIDSLQNITNEISVKVKEQYEENPYPRWKNTGLYIYPISISEFVKTSKLKVKNILFEKNKDPRILIAGCGTGQHSVMTASKFKNCSILAIDLSKKSLAYAKMKTEEFQIKNIEYKNADILDLENYKEKFDIIESSGVLHHMENPLLGWKVLTECLNHGGLMKIGLYSELARKHIAKIRKEIKSLKIIPNNLGIKTFREIIINSDKDHHKKIIEMSDFYSLSELRDLIFHVQEHHFTIPKLSNILDKLNLNFCGFDNQRIIKLYKKDNPKQEDLYNLKKWTTYEEKYPNTFLGMYQFWCQKV